MPRVERTIDQARKLHYRAKIEELRAKLAKAKSPREEQQLLRKIHQAGLKYGLTTRQMVDAGLLRIVRGPVVKSKIGDAKIARAVRAVIKNRTQAAP